LFKTAPRLPRILLCMKTHATDVAELREAYAALRDAVRGRVVLPDDPTWDGARRSWNLSVDQRPAAVVEAAGVEDVQAVVRLAARFGLRVAPQATGHGSEALGPLDGAVLLKTSPMRGIAIDPSAGLARVEAGALATEVAAAAGAHRRAPVLGLAPTVGVTGLTLGGGIGWLSRSHGLAANNVRALEVVLASGERRRVDARTEPELFWALRGGGGRTAIVTALEVEAHPVAEVSGGMVVWPAEHAAEVLEQFRRWTWDVPESLGAVLRYMDVPAFEAVPPALRGRKVVAVIAVHVGTEPDGRRLMAPLRAARSALVDTFGPIGAADLVHVARDPEQPAAARGDGFMVDGLPNDLLDTVAELIAEDALAPLATLELRLLGGALARTSEGHGALGSLDGAFLVFAAGAAGDAEARTATEDRLDHVRERLAPWRTPQALLSAARGGIDPALAFDDETWERLRRARDAFDPDRLIVANHPAA
jgi:FAD/FMN-containing dehydrogenase